MRRSARLLPLACLLALTAGCGSTRSTAPRAARASLRLVTIVVTDSLGGPAAGGFLRATSLADSAGLGRVLSASLDDSGFVRLWLTPGPWAFTGRVAETAGLPDRVVGVTAIVPGEERPADDTVRVAAAARTASVVRGRIRLSGAAGHAGTLVSLGAMDAFVLTDDAGDFTLGFVPPGRWTVTAFHGGYHLGAWPVEAPVPGSALTLPEDSLLVGDDLPGDPPTHSAARPVRASPPLTLR